MSNTDDEWVIGLLADAPRPALPADVATRLDTALRAQLDADAALSAVSAEPTEPATEGAVDPSHDEPTDTPEVVAESPAEPEPPVLAPVLSPPGRSWGSRREQRVENQGERRRQVLTRWLPVAAGVLVLGGAGVTALSLQSGQDSGTADEASGASAESAAAESQPRALVATGTDYATDDLDVFSQQVRDLVMTASSGDTATREESVEQDDSAAEAEPEAGDAQGDAEAEAPEESMSALSDAPGPADVSTSPLADREALQQCVDEVTAGPSDPPVAVDLAVVDGAPATVVVVTDPAGQDLLVYVVGPDCTQSRYDFFNVTP